MRLASARHSGSLPRSDSANELHIRALIATGYHATNTKRLKAIAAATQTASAIRDPYRRALIR